MVVDVRVPAVVDRLGGVFMVSCPFSDELCSGVIYMCGVVAGVMSEVVGGVVYGIYEECNGSKLFCGVDVYVA